MNFYPFHVGDYTLRTAHLEPMEDLAYRRLLDLYYVNEGPLQGDAAAIARLTRMRSHVDDVAVVLEEFFSSTPDGWRHSHCDEVIGQYQAKARQAAENGKKGGRPRKAPAFEPGPEGNPPETKSVKPGNPDQTNPDATDNPEITQPVNSANPDETGSKTNHKPVTNNQLNPNPLTPADAAVVAGAPAPESKKAPKKRFDPLTVKPENVSDGAWAEWCQFRREIRKPLTATMCRQQAKALADHHNPDAVLRQSIGNGWTGLFPNKIQSPPTGNIHRFPSRHSEFDDSDNDLSWMEQLRK